MSVSSPHFDPELYHIIHDVPVVDTFELVDSGWIDEAVPRMQALEKAGNVCPLILGHLDLSKKGREDDKTPQVGLVRNWKKAEVEFVGPVVLADYWFRKDKLADVKEHCGDLIRWSADIWLKHKEIDPVSLLGPTTPARRLGTIQLTRDGESPVTLSRFQGLTMPEPEKDTKSLGMESILKEVEGLKAAISEILSKLQAPAEGAKDGAGAPEAAPAGDEPEEMNDEELEKLIAELEQGKGKGQAPEAKAEKPVQAFASAGPTNMIQNSKDQETELRIAKLETENARLQLSRDLDNLEKDGVLWADEADKLADLELLLALPKTMQTAQLARIKAKYAQAPVSGRPLEAVQNARTSGKTVMTEDMKNKAVNHAAANKLSFGASCKVLFGKYDHEFAS